MLTTSDPPKAARALIGMEQFKRAERTRPDVNTMRTMKAAGTGPIAGRFVNVQAVQRTLEAAGLRFIPQDGGGHGVRLRDPLP